MKNNTIDLVLSTIVLYLIGVFLSGYFNPMMWMNIGKLIFLIFLYFMIDKFNKDRYK